MFAFYTFPVYIPLYLDLDLGVCLYFSNFLFTFSYSQRTVGRDKKVWQYPSSSIVFATWLLPFSLFLVLSPSGFFSVCAMLFFSFLYSRFRIFYSKRLSLSLFSTWFATSMPGVRKYTHAGALGDACFDKRTRARAVRASCAFRNAAAVRLQAYIQFIRGNQLADWS